jgi:chemotaxis protein methyltransferase WspC
MALQHIISILNEKIGLNPSSIGTSSIERAINHRITCRNCINIGEYSRLLAHDAKEVRELIEEVVVPETWFFRNKAPFEAFRNHVTKELLPKHNKRKPIRILSVPCATGEEPYSLAIALLEENIDPHAFRIDAIDVSKKSIELAKDAHFGKNSFRDVNSAVQQKYFTPTERGWLLDEAVKKLVKFKQGNILLGSLSPHPGFYDVVFCRNLLIYFDRKIQQLTLEKLYRTLKKGAILFVGHAECSQVSEVFFQPSPYPKSFSFIKRDKPMEKPTIGKPKENLPKIVAPPQNKNAIKQAVTKKVVIKKAITKKAISTKSDASKNKPVIEKGSDRKTTEQKPVIGSLRPAEKLANEGRYEEAEKFCNAFLEVHPDSAHAHYLLGLIKNSQGQQKVAESLLKKAIYLDPNHEPALVLSCLLAEQKGDVESVQSFKRRIQRVQSRKR